MHTTITDVICVSCMHVTMYTVMAIIYYIVTITVYMVNTMQCQIIHTFIHHYCTYLKTTTVFVSLYTRTIEVMPNIRQIGPCTLGGPCIFPPFKYTI